jgi:hypothetical protein
MRYTMYDFPDHPVIEEMERFGCLQQREDPEVDEDMAYEERRDRERFGEY